MRNVLIAIAYFAAVAAGITAIVVTADTGEGFYPKIIGGPPN